MRQTLRRHATKEQGFTLIELLVVILIIGILAAIAIPAFLNQRSKAYDASAKSNVRTAQTAMETYATDHDGSYPASVNTASATDPLVGLESALNNKPYVTGGSTASGYTLTAISNGSGTTDTFTMTDSSGTITRACSGNGGGCAGGSW